MSTQYFTKEHRDALKRAGGNIDKAEEIISAYKDRQAEVIKTGQRQSIQKVRDEVVESLQYADEPEDIKKSMAVASEILKRIATTEGSLFDEVEDALRIPTADDLRRDRMKTKDEFMTNFTYREEGRERNLSFARGAYSIVAARSGHGKTTFALNVLLDALANYPGQNHWFIGYEECRNNIINKLILSHSCGSEWRVLGADRNLRLLERHLRGEEGAITNLTARAEINRGQRDIDYLLQDGQLRVVYTHMDISELIRLLQRIGRDKKTGIVIIDYIQLIPAEAFSHLPRHEAVKQICLALTDVAVQAGITILSTAQFNREVKKKEDVMAQRISESSNIEYAANKILALWNNYAMVDGREQPGREKTIELQSLKTRAEPPMRWHSYRTDGKNFYIEREHGKGSAEDTRERRNQEIKDQGGIR